MYFLSILTKGILFVLGIFISLSIQCQSIKPYIGFHGGINFTQPNVISKYEIISTINIEEASEHEYKKIFENFGHQIGFTILLNLNTHFSLGFIPEISNYSYGYKSTEGFYNSQGDSVLTITNNVTSKLNYFNFPLFVQYKVKSGPFVPYLFIGGSFSLLRNAQQTVNELSLLQNQGANLEFEETSTNNNSSNYIKSKISAFAGIGASYEFTAFTLALDASYWFGFNNIINESNRFNNHSISGSTYELSDDAKLNHIVINASILFPINKNNGEKGALDCIPFKNRKK